MHFNIIGAGRLGKNVAHALIQAELARLIAMCNRSEASAHLALADLGQAKTAACTLENMPPADVVWITTNDDSIAPVVNALSESMRIKKGSLVIHCSGVFSSSILGPLQDQGCHVASFHPLKAFKKNNLEVNAFSGVHCVIEGDYLACAWLKTAFEQLNAQIIPIKAEAKTSYHAAAVMASNYLITLAACSEELLLSAGLNPTQARQMVVQLMQSNLDNVMQTPVIADALTGPIARGDRNTIAMHLEAIANPIIHQLYASAGLATLPLTHLPQPIQSTITKMLGDVSRETSPSI